MKKQLFKKSAVLAIIIASGVVKAQTTTSTFTLNSASDDMEEIIGGSIDPGSSDLEFVTEPNLGQQIVGIRFNNITIPNGSTITNAYIQFSVDEANTETTDLIIKAEANDNAVTFSTIDKVSTRAVTSNSINWTNVPAWQLSDGAGLNQRTPNLSPIIQDVVSRTGWSSGNSIAFIFSGSGKRVAEAYEKTSALNTPHTTLHIEYGTVSTNVNSNHKNEKTISIYPNPANQSIQIKGVDFNEEVAIKIISIDGKIMKDEIIHQSNITISDLNSGMYFMELTDAKGKTGVTKFVKE